MSLIYTTSFQRELRPVHERTWRAQLDKLRRKLIRAATEFSRAWTAENRPNFATPKDALEGALKIEPGSPEFEKATPRLRRAVTKVFDAHADYFNALRKGPGGRATAGEMRRKAERSVR